MREITITSVGIGIVSRPCSPANTQVQSMTDTMEHTADEATGKAKSMARQAKPVRAGDPWARHPEGRVVHRASVSGGRLIPVRARIMFVAAGMILLTSGLLGAVFATGVGAPGLSPCGAASEAQDVLGEGVVGDVQSASPLTDPTTVARWEPGEWRYRITAGPRRGQTERESLAPDSVPTRGETWERTVGEEYTLHLHRTAEGSLVLPSQIAHTHDALVRFEPPLAYLIAGLEPGERRVFDATMDVYRSSRPAMKLYRGNVRATTLYAGMCQVTTPAGMFRAAVIKTDYEIDILSLVSVRDTLYTFYAEGVGKVAEAERRRVAMGVFKTDTKVGKVLLSFSPVSPSSPRDDVQSPSE